MVRNEDGDVSGSDYERLYIRFKGFDISSQLIAHCPGIKCSDFLGGMTMVN